jgi:hypothetical protein
MPRTQESRRRTYLKARSSVRDPDLDPQDRRIRKFFGLPDPDPLVRGMDLDPAPDPGGFPFPFKVLSGLK